ncbi:MAG: hypothetical protein E7408_06015 [Ruminococcaceae bacterium]|nr:hypothetical protein [Oscillospiraceae bacterium]
MKTKSITSLILSLLMIVTLLPVLPQSVAAAEATPLIQNGDFEKLENGWPAGWDRCCRPEDPHSALETETVRSGKTAVRIIAEENVLPYTFQNVKGLMPGATYEASVWANVHLTNAGAGAFFKIEFHGLSGTPSLSSDTCTGDTDGVFERHAFEFTVPEGTTSVNVLCRFNGTGYVIFDDMEIIKIRDPEKFSFGFGDVFHYPHEEKGTAWVNLASFYKGLSVEAEATVDFALRDGEKVLHSMSDVHFTNLTAEYTYDISLLKEKKKPYTIHATAKWNGEEETFSQNVYVYDRPSIIGEDGIVRIDGKGFNPIMGYHIKDFTWDKVAESGINVVQFGAGGHSEAHIKECDRVLDILDDNGMKALFVLYKNMKPAAHPDNIEFAKAYVNRFKDDPRIYAWAVMDEPFSANATPEMRALIEESYTLVRNIDSMHPVHLTDVYTETTKYCDIHSIDMYLMNNDNQGVYNYLTERTDEINSDCHMQYIGRTFTFGNDPKGVPSTKIVRGYVYRAFEAGMKGIGYFSVQDAVSYPDPMNPNRNIDIPLYDMEYEDGFSWSDFSRLNKEEVPVLYDIYVHNKYKLLNEYEGGRAASSPYWGTWTDGKVVYLIVHNKTNQAVTIKPSLSSANGLLSIGKATIKKIGDPSAVSTSLSNTGFLLKAQEAALYKITPEEELDLSKLEKTNILPNPSFEAVTSGTPDGWTFGGDVSYRGVVTNAEQSFAGEKYIKLSLGNCRINTFVPVRGNTSYRLSVHYRASQDNAGVFGTEYHVGDTPYRTYLENNNLPYCTNMEGFGGIFGRDASSLEWKKAEFQFTTPPYVDKMRVQFSNNAAVNDPNFAIDAVMLIETDDLPNLLPNGSFEYFTDKEEGKAASWLWSGAENTSGVSTVEIYTDKDGTILPKGESCLKFVSDSVQKTEKFPYLNFYLVPGSYTLSFRYRHESAEREDHAAAIHLGDAIRYACPQEAGKWYDHFYTFTVTSGTTMHTLQVPGSGEIAGTYYFDDFVLLPVETGITLYEAFDGSEDTAVLKGQGSELSKLWDAESKNGVRTVTVKADYVPVSDQDGDAMFYVCVYGKKDGRKELVSLSNSAFNETQSGKAYSAYKTVSVPENTKSVTYSVECFLWHRSEGMILKPITPKTIFS